MVGSLQAQTVDTLPIIHPVVSCESAPVIPLDSVTVDGVTVTQSVRVDIAIGRSCAGVIYRAHKQNTEGKVKPFVVLYPPCKREEKWILDRLAYESVDHAVRAIAASKCP
jgi:hypothetical protein